MALLADQHIQRGAIRISHSEQARYTAPTYNTPEVMYSFQQYKIIFQNGQATELHDIYISAFRSYG